jgi:AcrR family transcriptional regulator
MPRALSTAEQDDFRDRVCDAAAKLFREQGLAGITMRQIAAELDCSPMLPYRYFNDREEILANVRARAYEAFADALTIAFESGGDPVDRSRRLGHAYVDFALTRPNDYRLMFDMTQPDEDRYERLAAASRRARVTLTRRFEDLIAAGIIEGDPEELGYSFWAATHGVMVLYLAGKLPPDVDCRDLYNVITRTMFRGVRGAKGRHADRLAL